MMRCRVRATTSVSTSRHATAPHQSGRGSVISSPEIPNNIFTLRSLIRPLEIPPAAPSVEVLRILKCRLLDRTALSTPRHGAVSVGPRERDLEYRNSYLLSTQTHHPDSRPTASNPAGGLITVGAAFSEVPHAPTCLSIASQNVASTRPRERDVEYQHTYSMLIKFTSIPYVI